MTKNKILDSTKRFLDRVKNYIKYRPDYPKEMLFFLKEEIGLSSLHTIADIGSGTGISSEIFLKNGNKVYGVEPNDEMRKAAEKLLKDYNNFISVNARAEATTLETHSIDYVVAGQAFHWFDAFEAKKEFKRIIKPEGLIILIWNQRKADATSFLKKYDELLYTFGTDYEKVTHKNIDEKRIQDFFHPNSFKVKTFENKQIFDFESLKGRLLSSSYVPTSEHPTYSAMIEELQRIFEENKVNGKIEFLYDTNVYYGRIN